MEIFSNPWVLTIVGGVIVFVIGLWIEYKFFKKEKPLIIRKASPKPDWPKATEKAIREFKLRVGKYRWINEKLNCKNHKN